MSTACAILLLYFCYTHCFYFILIDRKSRNLALMTLYIPIVPAGCAMSHVCWYKYIVLNPVATATCLHLLIPYYSSPQKSTKRQKSAAKPSIREGDPKENDPETQLHKPPEFSIIIHGSMICASHHTKTRKFACFHCL